MTAPFASRHDRHRIRVRASEFGIPPRNLHRRDVPVVVLAALLLGCASSSSSSATTPRTAPTPAASPRATPAVVQPPARANTPVPAPRTVAVLPLTGGAGMEGLGFALSEILARDLAAVPRVRVVERARLDAVLKELGLATTGRVTVQSVPRAGQLVGADRVLSGTVTRTANGGASIDVALLNVQTSATEPVYTERLALNALIDAQEQLAEKAFTKLGVDLTPGERERLAKRPTRRVDALIAFGNGRRADAMGNPAQARTYYATAARLDPAFVSSTGVLLGTPSGLIAVAPVTLPVGASTAASAAASAAALSTRVNARSPFDRLIDDLSLSITDRVVRPAAPPAVCPPTCPALGSASGTVTVRITP